MSIRGGAFESCFATGLDLSEFSSAGNNKYGNADCERGEPCASLEWLEVKAKESSHREFQEQEDVRIQQIAEQRAQHLKQSQSTKSTSPVVLFPEHGPTQRQQDHPLHGPLDRQKDALEAIVGGMHGNGDSANLSRASRRQLCAKGKRLAKQTARLLSEQKQSSKKGKLVVKKHKHRKHVV